MFRKLPHSDETIEMRKKANASGTYCLFCVFVIPVTAAAAAAAAHITHVKPLSKIYMFHKTWFTKDEEVGGKPLY